MPTEREARSHRKGHIELNACVSCGFIFNPLFDSRLQEFSGRYEETQGFSSTFRAFHRRLATDLIDRFDLRGRRVVEIGCGKGEFLALLCELGDNEGLGFDPAFLPERNPAMDDPRARFVRELYPPPAGVIEQWGTPDFVCCKMTLEHIPDVGRFVRGLRDQPVSDSGTVFFFQVPDAARILEEAAFWDVYYEHCSYFTASSLTRLFAAAGFHVLDTWTDYGDQYLMLAALPAFDDGSGEESAHSAGTPLGAAVHGNRATGFDPAAGTEDERPKVAGSVGTFESRVAEQVAAWRTMIGDARGHGHPTVIWGGGSKAVAFCSAMGTSHQPDLVVDINPYKQGTFLPGTGQEIVAPERLQGRTRSLVIVMNPVYLEEVRVALASMNADWPTVGLGEHHP
jgi:SAM-dependent methyltransferase